ncbi:MAG: hypothetical protein IKB20_04460 [Clostridia bacterium]|nr:hypothetical protein [Clostridia bacterium]
MDAKITKRRLAQMLSYDWLKIVAIIVAVIFAWALVFTTTATRITPAQQFTVMNYYTNTSLNRGGFYSSYQKAFTNGVFSHEVLETNTVDLTISEEYYATLLQTRVATNEGDVLFIPDLLDFTSAYEQNGETLYDTHLQTFLRGYGYAIYNLDPNAEDGFFQQMENYVNQYYVNGQLNEEKVEQDFLARIKKNKDKRYKKQAQIDAGIKADKERIQKYTQALTEFYGYLNAGLVCFTNVQAIDREDDNKVVFEGQYFLNLCPNEATMGGLKDIFGYETQIVNEETGETQTVVSAVNMNVAFFKFAAVEEGFAYESLLFVNHIIRTVQGL